MKPYATLISKITQEIRTNENTIEGAKKTIEDNVKLIGKCESVVIALKWVLEEINKDD